MQVNKTINIQLGRYIVYGMYRVVIVSFFYMRYKKASIFNCILNNLWKIVIYGLKQDVRK